MDQINLAILSPNRNAYSETFIKAHVEKLQFNNFLYDGGWLPEYCNAKKILSSNFFIRSFRYISRKLFKKTFEEIISKALIKSFKKNNINAILAEYGPTGVAILPIAQKTGIPLFIFFHGQDASKKSRLEENKKKYIQLSKEAAGIFLASQTLADNLVKLGCSSEKFIINPYKPNEIFFNNNPDFQKQNIFAVGRFTNKKAPHLTILAFKKVLEKFPQAQLRMAGSGKELLEACISLVKALKIENNVTFLGVLTPEEVKQQMDEAYMFVQHSVTPEDGDQEGSPVAIVEAAASGLPVVSTRHSGIKESVIDGQTGYLANEYDIDTMSQRMIELLEDKALAMRMGENAKQHIKENYTHHFEIIEKAIKAIVN